VLLKRKKPQERLREHLEKKKLLKERKASRKRSQRKIQKRLPGATLERLRGEDTEEVGKKAKLKDENCKDVLSEAESLC